MRKTIKRFILSLLGSVGFVQFMQGLGMAQEQAVNLQETLAGAVVFFVIFAADHAYEWLRNDVFGSGEDSG